MVSVPEIDYQAGIECYCTEFLGIQGRIKEINDEFQVSEIIADHILEPPFFSTDQNVNHKYPIYMLEKNNVDSNHALIEIKRECDLNLKILGIKDAKALTRQYAGSQQTKNVPRKLRTSRINLTLLGYLHSPLSRSNLIGNKFSIKINNTNNVDTTYFLLELDKISNFYGLQRFGSARMVTHLVGKEILKGKFDKAIEYLLSFTSRYDSTFLKEIREKSKDPNNYNTLVKSLPKGMDIERNIMNVLINGKGSLSALRSIPITIRRLFVHAYQSFLYNKCLSQAILSGEDICICKDGDLCFEAYQPLVFGKIRKFKNGIDSNNKTVPAIRLVGYNFQAGRNRYDSIIKGILIEEEILAKNFYIKELQELSLQMGFRQTILCCHKFNLTGKTSISFALPKGSYATTLLRELMKPNDPIQAGF